MNKKILERELNKARRELFMATNLHKIKFLQKKIAYLQQKIKEVS
jgi:hypothetical protein